MKILIAGEPESGQRQVIEKLTGKEPNQKEPLVGYVQSHQFTTKYFSADCSLWADEYEDAADWSREFSSSEAKEVRDALVLYIHTFERAADPRLADFVDALDRPGVCVAVPKRGADVSAETLDRYEEMGFEVVQLDEIERLVHTALFDALDEDGEVEEALPVEAARAPPRDLDEIMQELQAARDSTTMTKDDKMALAERLAAELV